MKRAIGVVWLAFAGCAGAGEEPILGRESAIEGAASPSDVAELGVDEAGCLEAVEAGGEATTVAGRPDLVGVAIEGNVVCVTTLRAAIAADLDPSWWADLHAGGVPMSGDAEPEPEPYLEDGESAGEEAGSEPEPEPYDGDDDSGAGDTSGSTDSK